MLAFSECLSFSDSVTLSCVVGFGCSPASPVASLGFSVVEDRDGAVAGGGSTCTGADYVGTGGTGAVVVALGIGTGACLAVASSTL